MGSERATAAMNDRRDVGTARAAFTGRGTAVDAFVVANVALNTPDHCHVWGGMHDGVLRMYVSPRPSYNA